MIRRSKASPTGSAAQAAGSTAVAGRTFRNLFGLACLCVLGLAAFLGTSAPAAPAADAFPGQGFLPDNRAWELVSPPDKNGGNVSADPLRVRSAPDGGAVQFASIAPFADAIGASVFTDYVARRTAEPGTQGWATHAVTPQQEAFSGSDIITVQIEPKYEGEFSSDFSKAVFFSKSPVPLGSSPNVGNFQLLYRRNDLLTPGPGSYSLLSECAAPPAGPCATPPLANVKRVVKFADASSDFGSVIFESLLALTNDAPDNGEPKLYLSEGGLPRLVGILPDAACASPPCPADSSAAGQGAGTNGSAISSYTMGTITEDGSRVIFTSPVDPDSQGLPDAGPTAPNLYLRDDHGTPSLADDTTAPISADGNPPGVPSEQPAKVWAATTGVDAQGDRVPLKVFFTSGSQLYRWDEAAQAGSRLTLISVDTEPDDESGAVRGAIGSSASGDYVYFIANNQLVDDDVPGTTESPCNPPFTKVCIFVWHDEGGGDSSIRQVATIGGAEAEFTIGAISPIFGHETKTARVTPDGTHLLFASLIGSELDAEAGVPGYDHGKCEATDLVPWNAGGNLECAETYIYDATANSGAGQLRCASCNPDGIHATPYDSAFFQRGADALDETVYLNNPLSEDGRFVFFSTAEALVPEDTNGRVDVYEFDATTGQQHLISGGESSTYSLFVNASPDGHSVFFTTRQRLTGWDVDEQQDLYVARINGGIADPPPSPLPCEGDACQPPPVVPNDPTPGSSSFSGPGNGEAKRSTTRRCGKGKRRATVHGKARCLKKPTKHKRRASR